MLVASHGFARRLSPLSLIDGELADARDIPRDIELPPIDSTPFGDVPETGSPFWQK
jgi:hypothetical protein